MRNPLSGKRFLSIRYIYELNQWKKFSSKNFKYCLEKKVDKHTADFPVRLSSHPDV